MPDEPILREMARAAIQRRKLPSRRPDRMWSGPGVGAECTLCGEPIGIDQFECEIQFAHERRTSPIRPIDTFRLHLRCLAAWEFERVQIAERRSDR